MRPYVRALREHWPEYLYEAVLLGLFMVSAGCFAILLWHPGSVVSQTVTDELARRALMGLAMGLTAVGLIYSPWGQQSGAHMNPAVTLTFLRLGKVHKHDAVFYIAAQLAGGLLGVLLVWAVAGEAFSHPKVSWVVTVPGAAGLAVAFGAEMVIAVGMMLMVLTTISIPRLSRLTGYFAGILVFFYITIEAPLSGMSLNPARTLASALPSGIWTGAWIYFLAPPLGMQLAVALDRRLRRRADVHCAKLDHDTTRRCIHCGYGMDSQNPKEIPAP